jgi:hypothetical protein
MRFASSLVYVLSTLALLSSFVVVDVNAVIQADPADTDLFAYSWQLNGPSEVLITMKSKESGYMALAFHPSNTVAHKDSMDCIMTYVDGATGEAMRGISSANSAPTDVGRKVTVLSASVSGGVQTVEVKVFYDPVTADKGHKLGGDGPVKLWYAVANAKDFTTYHAVRGKMDDQDFMKEMPAGTGGGGSGGNGGTDSTDWSQPGIGGGGTTSTTTDNGNRPPPLTDSDPGVQNVEGDVNRPGLFQLSWSPDVINSVVDFKLVTNAKGYVSLGWVDAVSDRAHVDMDCVIGWVNGTRSSGMNAYSQSFSAPLPDQPNTSDDG